MIETEVGLKICGNWSHYFLRSKSREETNSFLYLVPFDKKKLFNVNIHYNIVKKYSTMCSVNMFLFMEMLNTLKLKLRDS